MNSKEIRQSFLEFFAKKGHKIYPSSSLLPESPNLLFTNAGMNAFVPYFLGERKTNDLRIVDTQKCIRSGGKHNDLEGVGFDTYHHTFFEMLGNWSIGDYFKAEAINWAWELLTKVWKLPKNRLYATVYKPEKNDPAEFDNEAYGLWETIFKNESLDPKKHIVLGNKKDNFWMMSDTGPCGPCSEIHMDLTADGLTDGKLVNTGDPRCIEIWNLVFIQYNALADGTFVKLTNKFVDTGMGFERIAGIFATTNNLSDFSKLPSNYASDLFVPIFEWLENKTNHKYQGLILNKDSSDENALADCAFRIIADHIRTLTCAIADGIFPGNLGRNYVLRRIVRRALLFGKNLNLKPGFFSELSSIVVEVLGDVFPELPKNAKLIKDILKKEEEAFDATLNRGLQLFMQWLTNGITKISGDQAFLLYDTYGFPFDLTQLLAKKHNIEVDIDGFSESMDQQKKLSKQSTRKTFIEILDNSSEKEQTRFIGYTTTKCEATVLNIINNDDKLYIVTDQTPFYAEKGGQIGDTGIIKIKTISKNIKIISAYFKQQVIVHELELIEDKNVINDIKNSVGQTVTLEVDQRFRKSVSRNHTATHILQWALRKTIGNHVNQTGSIVTNKKLRFDFSHFEKISQEKLTEIEEICNEKIFENSTVVTTELNFNEKPNDCLAFFEDKYGDKVRLVAIDDFSKELCCGTHVKSTSDIGQFKILQETSVAAGIRRIEAITGIEAYRNHKQLSKQIIELENQFECKCDKICEKYQKLKKQKKESDIRYIQAIQQVGLNSKILNSITINNLHCIQLKLLNVDVQTLRTIVGDFFNKNKIDVIVSACEYEGKCCAIAFCSNQAIYYNIYANSIICNFMKLCGASGGGKNNFASGGTSNIDIFKEKFSNLNFKNLIQ